MCLIRLRDSRRVVATANHLFLLLCILSTGASCACAEPETLKVMSLNIWVDGKAGGQPLSQTAQVIKAANPDIVGVQEVHSSTKALADLLGWNYVQQRPGVAVLTRFEIAGTTETTHGVKIRTNAGQTVFIFNMHLMHAPYQPYQLLGIPYHNAPFLKTESQAIDAARKARGETVTALLEDIKRIEDKSAPVFVTGDFNEPSHLDWTQEAADLGRHPIKVVYPASKQLTDAGFIDTYRAKYPSEIEKPGYTWTPRTEANDPNDHHDRIDFVFAKEGSVVTKVAVVGESSEHADIVVAPYPSDHRGVVATIRIANPSRAGGS